MQGWRLWVLLAVLAVLAMLAVYLVRPVPLPPRKAPPPTAEDHEARRRAERAAVLVRARCVGCHDLRPVCLALGRADKGAWDRILTRMMFKGAVLEVEDKLLVVDWLWTLPPGSSPPCAKAGS